MTRVPPPWPQPEEPAPVRAFTGWTNGNTDPTRYRAHLVRYEWSVKGGYWTTPDSSWSWSLCERQAYPRRWITELFHPDSIMHTPELSTMTLCAACARTVAETYGVALR